MKNEFNDRITPRFLEMFAEAEHQSWSDWMEYLFSKCERNKDGTMTIPSWAVERWERQIKTHYSDLSEQEKQSDRDVFNQYRGHIVRGVIHEKVPRNHK